MNKLPIAKRCKIIQLLCEGCSMRSISRIVDVSINTVTKILIEAGQFCMEFHDSTVHDINSTRIQCDEIWSFVYSKEKNTSSWAKGIGNVWTWVGIDPDSKLVVAWHVGHRNLKSAKVFMADLKGRLKSRVQLSSDGFIPYLEAVDDTFGGQVDFAQLVKIYSNNSHNKKGKLDKRMKYIGADRITVSGNPDKGKICTSHIERQNLTMRMHMRRFTRKTNAFSKKLQNHIYAQALHFVYYNFIRIHKSLRVTPAMECKLCKRPMSFEDLVKLM